jgi:hypothetical protein
MNKTDLRKVIIALSLWLLLVFPMLFYIKSLTEPINWWIQSAWHPLPVFLTLEALSGFSLIWNLSKIRKITIDPNSAKVAVLMMTLGALTFCLVIFSVIIFFFQWLAGVFIGNSLYIYISTVAISLTTLSLDRYFEGKIHEKTIIK